MVTEKSCNQNNGQTSLKNKKVELVEPVQMDIYQSIIYGRIKWNTFSQRAKGSRVLGFSGHKTFLISGHIGYTCKVYTIGFLLMIPQLVHPQMFKLK